jgi:CMP-N-acetylneuraminic acid synthetase
MKIFFIIKEKSQRVKDKNFIKLDGLPLYKYVLKKFRHFKVFVDTDSEKIIRDCKKDKELKHVFCYKREKKFINLEKSKYQSPTPLLLKNFIENFAHKDKIVISSHITSPFIKVKTLKKAIKKMNQFDSVASCTEIQNFSYLKCEKKFSPINFNPRIIQKTQNLKKIIHLHGAFFIFKREIFLNNGLQRITKNNFFYDVKFPENLDLDNYEDFVMARQIIKKKFE